MNPCSPGDLWKTQWTCGKPNGHVGNPKDQIGSRFWFSWIEAQDLDMSFYRCECGKHIKFTTAASKASALSRCRKEHVKAGQLVLGDAPHTIQSMVFFILGHGTDRSMHRVLVKDLHAAGVPDGAVMDVCYGATIGDAIGPKILQPNQVCHWSILHRGLRKIAHMIKKRKKGRKRTTVVYLLEADCVLGNVTAQQMLEIAGHAKIVWPGYRVKKTGGNYARSYGQYVNIEGSHALCCSGDGLLQLYRTLIESPQYCHIDYLYSRALEGVYLNSALRDYLKLG